MLKSITSTHNPLLKQLKKLATSEKARRQQGQAIIEGIHLAQSFIQANWAIDICLVDDQWSQNPEVSQVVQHCLEYQLEVIAVPRSIFATISTLEQGIGLLLVIPIPPTPTPPSSPQSALLLDTIQDPGNLGTMLRTAAAAGLAYVYCSSACASVYSPKVLRAAMGAHTALHIIEGADLNQVIPNLSIPIYATSLQASTSIYGLNLTQPAAWLMGSEGQGVSASLLQLPQVTKVIIPQSPHIESLNVATATAICLFEQRRQLLHKSALI